MSTNSARFPKIGVLDIQGSVEEHIRSFRRLGIEPVAVKNKKDLKEINGLVIPGGESTVIGKLIRMYGMDKEIKFRANMKNWGKSKPLCVWGTCAGAILLAKKILGDKKPDILALMDISIKRNAYGSQMDSFETKIYVKSISDNSIPAVFIRAPMVKSTSGKVKILAYVGKDPVMAREDNLLITTFHPELTNSLLVHKYFVSMTKAYEKAKK